MKKKKFRPGWKMGVAVLLGIPLMIKAADITGDYLEISYWGIFGSSWGSATSNVAIGDYNTWDTGVMNSLSVGSNLKTYDSDSLAVGTWNADTSRSELFIIGRGTGSLDKKNSLEVYLDGTDLEVRAVEPQGDIPTGIHSSYTGLLMLGQLKYAATEAFNDLEGMLPGGAGYSQDNYFSQPSQSPPPTQSWYDQQRNAVVVGEVKAIATPLYGRLEDYASSWVDTQFTANGIGGWAHDVPWNPATAVEENYDVATVAHLRLVYGLDLAADSDTDTIPDVLEHFLYGDLNGGPQMGTDYDGDGLNDVDEIADGTTIWIADTDGDGLLDGADGAPLTPISTGGSAATTMYVWSPNE